MATVSMAAAVILASVLIFARSPVSEAQCLSDNDDLRSPNLNVEGLLNGSTTFGLALFNRLLPNALQSEANLVLSPLSIWSALLMTYVGAKGQTEKELNAVLGLANASKADVGRAYKAVKYWYLLRAEQGTNGNYTLNLVDNLFVEKTLVLRSCILKYFGKEITPVDFARSPERAREVMNGWVERETRNKIRELFQPGVVNSHTLLSVVNAAYFKGLWDSQFKKENTRKEQFRVTSSRFVTVDMMHQKAEFFYGTNEQLGCQILEMPFIGEEVSMIYFLPHKDTVTIETVSRLLSAELLRNVRNDMRRTIVDVSLPKFRIENSFELTQTLSAMGIRDLFIASQANLAGFSEERRLAVSSTRHKAFLEVNEEGSEAAAATDILAWRSARPAFPLSFVANKPFVFLLHDNLSNAILFLGVVKRPEGSNDI